MIYVVEKSLDVRFNDIVHFLLLDRAPKTAQRIVTRPGADTRKRLRKSSSYICSNTRATARCTTLSSVQGMPRVRFLSLPGFGM